MDRLSPVVLALSALLVSSLTGCADDVGPASGDRSRVNAVKAAPRALSKDAAAWCDVSFPAGTGPALALPPVVAARAGAQTGPLAAGRLIWVNLWATWCGPCLREMPLIEAWMGSFSRDGLPVDLWFLSVDESAEDLSSFFASHPEVARGRSVRLLDPIALRPWLERYRLAGDTAIPINVIAGPDGRVQCVRTGSINDSHLPAVRELLRRMK